MAARKPKGRKAPPKKSESRQPLHEPFVEDESPGQASLPFPIVGIGASAGGLEAFTQLLHALPADTGMAFVFVQHLDPTHPSMLTEILSRATVMPVSEVTDQITAEPNHVYVIPPGVTMGMERGILRLSPRKQTRGQHRPIDDFLSSLAHDQGHLAIGVILSGSATDGTLGLESIKAEGGITFAQDDTAQHRSMPNSAVAAGGVDFVLPPTAIAAELHRISRHPYVASDVGDEVESRAGESSLGHILDQLRMTTGVDFTNYKRNTLYRRISRRAVLHKFEGLKDYARYLESHPGEVSALYQDILISVTSFFRNPDTFEVLKSKVFPKLTKDRSRHDPLRIWSLGCSTGEEAYSIAIAFAEFIENSRAPVALQLFATDLNGVGIEKARVGLYPRTIAQDVSAERLRRFFFEADGMYRIAKTIRDSTVFARHNVLTEPPFSRIDLISCRNLLIYMEPMLQQRAMEVMHYALQPHGVLWLGNSEAMGSHRDLFEVDDAKHKFYVKKPGTSRLTHAFPHDRPGERRPGDQRAPEVSVPGSNVHREADRVLLTKYAPASVLVNADMDVLQFRGETGLYLAPAPGKASLGLLKMLREGLLVGVRGAIHKARREEASVREEGLRVKSIGGYRDVNVQVIPVKETKAGAQAHYLVLFEDTSPLKEPGTKGAKAEPRKGRIARTAARKERDGTERETARLTQELAATREYLQSVIEQQDAVNEELQSSNEEVQSANEELQSINEELETSKEEIESSNEELATVNEELQNRNTELGQSNNDFINLLASAQLGIVMLGPDLRIRRFTPMAKKLFNLIAGDVGRPITDIQLGIGVPNLDRLLTEAMDTVSVRESEVRDKEGRWYVLRLQPYRTVDNKIEGAVLVLLDVDALKRQQGALRRQSELLDQANEAIFMWELDGGITYWNRGAEETYGFTKEQALGRTSYELLGTSPGPSVFLEPLQRLRQWSGELTQRRGDGQLVVVESRMVMEGTGDRPPLVFETNHPITERKRMEEGLRRQAAELLAAHRNKDEFLAMLAHELRNPLAPLSNALEILRQPGASSAIADRAREIMSHQIHSMARMVDDLLDASRMTQGRIQLHKEPVECLTVIERVIEASRHHIDGRDQALTLSLPTDGVYMEADVVRLEQILANLLNNASKFTPPGGQISLTLEGPSTGTAQAVIRVKDSGMGIAPEHLEHVFTMFMQIDSSLNRATGGLGIGLTLVRHLVELHGGSVEAHSAGIGQGSEFVVRLPAHQESPHGTPRAAPAPRSNPQSLSRRVLVTDDNVEGAETLAILLRGAGHDVRVAHSGQAALEIARTFKPEIVFLDVGMPGMNGYETARQLRRIAGNENALLVALTGYGQGSDRERAQYAGFDEFLVKPALPDVVRSLVARTRSTKASQGPSAADR